MTHLTALSSYTFRTHVLHPLDSSFLLLPVGEIRASAVLVDTQHGNEIEAREAGAAVIDHVFASLRGQPHTIADRVGQQTFSPMDLAGIAVLAVPAMNAEAISWGVRRLGERPWTKNLRDCVDLNRTWPEGEHVRHVWAAIRDLPQDRPVVVLDFHSTYKDRQGEVGRAGTDGIPDSHIYVTGHTRRWLEESVQPGWLIVDEPMGMTPTGMPLDEAASAAGYYGLTIEHGRGNGVPGVEACELVSRIVAAMPTGLPR